MTRLLKPLVICFILFINIISPQYLSSDKTNWITRLMFFIVSYLKKIQLSKICFRVTKEHRETLSKNAKALFIKCKDSIKDVQNKFIKSVKNKEKTGLSEDTAQLICEFVSLLYLFNTDNNY